MTNWRLGLRRAASAALVAMVLMAPPVAVAQTDPPPPPGNTPQEQWVKFLDYALCAVSIATVTPATAVVAVLTCGKLIAMYYDS